MKSRSFIDDLMSCPYCGAELPEGRDTRNPCDNCVGKAAKWRSGEWYVVVYDPTDGRPFHGGHFKREEMKTMLKERCAVEGMRMEVWKQGVFVRLVIVVGPEDAEQHLDAISDAAYVAKGDGRFLVPEKKHATHQR